MSKMPNIYPPEFPDPLKPGPAPDPEGVAKDAYLRQLAADVGAGEADSLESEGDLGEGSTAPPRGKPRGSGS